jgi:DNA repair exonuclease SbcCD ATPase subunit
MLCYPTGIMAANIVVVQSVKTAYKYCKLFSMNFANFTVRAISNSTSVEDLPGKSHVEAWLPNLRSSVTVFTLGLLCVLTVDFLVRIFLPWISNLVRTLQDWDFGNMDYKTAKVALQAAWAPRYTNGALIIPAVVQDHLSKAETAALTPETKQEVNLSSDYAVMKSYIGPFWFPFGFAFTVHDQTIYFVIASGADRLDMPTTVELPSLIVTQKANIASLEAALEDAQIELASKNKFIEQTNTTIARKSREQTAHIIRAHMDVDIIREQLRQFKARVAHLRTHDQNLRASNQSLAATVAELTLSNDSLKEQIDQLSRTNKNWIETLHSLQSPDPAITDLHNAYNRAITSNQTLLTNNQYLSAVSAANAKDLTQTQNKLNNALYTIQNLRGLVSEKDAELDTFASSTKTWEEKLSSAQLNTAALEASVKELQTRNQALESMNQVFKFRDNVQRVDLDTLLQTVNEQGWELDWLRYSVEETGRYAGWECEGFEDEGGQDVVAVDEEEEEEKYDSVDTVELSESEDESTEGFEEVLMQEVEERFEKVAWISGDEESEGDSEEGF